MGRRSRCRPSSFGTSLATATACTVCVSLLVQFSHYLSGGLFDCLRLQGDLASDGVNAIPIGVQVDEKKRERNSGAYPQNHDIRTRLENLNQLSSSQLRKLADGVATKAARLRVIVDAKSLASVPARIWTSPDPNANFASNKSLPLLAVVSLSSGIEDESGKAFWQHRLSYINKLAYCQKWGYDLIIDTIPSTDLEGREPAWGKIPFLRKLIRLDRYQWIMWMDMDAFFMRFDLPVHQLISDKGDLIITKDWHGINTGVFFMRSCPYSTFLLSQMWSVPEHFWEPWYEQSALMALLGSPAKRRTKSTKIVPGTAGGLFVNEKLDPEKYNTTLHQQHIVYLPQREMNAYGEEFGMLRPNSTYHEGDRIVHFPGCQFYTTCRTTMESFYQKMLVDSGVEDDGTSKVPSRVYFSAYNLYGDAEFPGMKLILDDVDPFR